MTRRAFPEPDFETRRLGQETAELALRTEQIIAYESGVAATVDALGGSYAMESLQRRRGGSGVGDWSYTRFKNATDFLEERVLGPLAMKETGFSVPDGIEARLAKIY